MKLAAFGHELDYEVRGADGPLLVCVPGLTVDRRILVESVEPALKRRRLRRVYLDLPGHGASRADPDRASADELCGSLYQLARALNAEAPLFVGYSYGGYLARGLLPVLPVGGLFLICPVVEPDFARRRVVARRVVEAEPLTFCDEVERAGFQDIAVVQTRAALEAFRRVVHPANLATDRRVIDAVRQRYLRSAPLGAAWQALRAPTAIVCGRDDHWVGFEDAAQLVATQPCASLTVVPDAGHLLPLEQAQKLQASLDEWLDRCAVACSS
jgi:pimeloyl-ACP methyl ester carboxylesterase